MFDFFGRKSKKENERLKAENARLAAENADLRPLAEEGRENRELADSFMGHKPKDIVAQLQETAQRYEDERNGKRLTAEDKKRFRNLPRKIRDKFDCGDWILMHTWGGEALGITFEYRCARCT